LSGFVFSIRLQRGGEAHAREAEDVLKRDMLEGEGKELKAEG